MAAPAARPAPAERAAGAWAAPAAAARLLDTRSPVVALPDPG